MPALRTYNVFISHAWKYNDQYYKLESMLDAASNFSWKDYSVPIHDPLVDPKTKIGKEKLIGLLAAQIKPVHIVIIVSGMYVAHREWQKIEIEIAEYYKKPIIGVTPWGSVNVPLAVQQSAEIICGFRTDSIVSAIREYAK